MANAKKKKPKAVAAKKQKVEPKAVAKGPKAAKTASADRKKPALQKGGPGLARGKVRPAAVEVKADRSKGGTKKTEAAKAGTAKAEAKKAVTKAATKAKLRVVTPPPPPPAEAVDQEIDLTAAAVETPIDDQTYLLGLLEALIFCTDHPVDLKELARAAGLDRKRTTELLQALMARNEERGLRIEHVAEGYCIRTHPRYAEAVRKLLASRPVRLSRAQLETLAIIAYRQPVTRPDVDEIRGVDSGPVLKGLLERDLIKIIGKKDEPGRPILYGTSKGFLELFNLASLTDLPTLREFAELNEESRRKFAETLGEDAPEDPLAALNSTPPESEVASVEGTDGEGPSSESAPAAAEEAAAGNDRDADEEDDADDDDDDDDEDDEDDDDDDDDEDDVVNDFDQGSDDDDDEEEDDEDSDEKK
ncbi:MAG TPA: SMC-Scp complex subunit ScpB [Polyangiaceae bacterium]|nr:SMC-Scp complex subunit ScpB [Polyangiaceae bacterium]